MPSPIRVGFVGLSTAGWAASTLGPSLLQPSLQTKYKLVAVSTTSEVSAKSTADKHASQLGHPVKAYYGDSSRVAADPEIDLVVVSVKTQYHKDTILPVIAQKKDFFLEWPAGRDLKETMEIAEAAKKQGVKTFIGLQARNSPVIKKVKELVRSGAIGTVRSTAMVGFVPRETYFWPPLVTPESAAYTVNKSNGATALSISLGHQLDPLTFILGDFRTLTATATMIYPTASVVDPQNGTLIDTVPAQSPDHYTISGLLQSGAMATIVWRTGYKNTPGRRHLLWEIHGEDGSIKIESDTSVLSAFMNVHNPNVYLNGEKIEIDGTDTHVMGTLGAAWEAYADGDEEQYANIDDAIRNHRILDAVKRSVEEGKTITLWLSV